MTFDVLIIEDDPKIAEIHRYYTEKIAGFSVVGVADNLEDAEKMRKLFAPDLILLDFYFPDGLGSDIIWKVRGEKQATDIIMITAAKEIETLQEAMRGGVFDYIVKPVIFSRFKETLERYREHREKIQNDRSLDQKAIDRLLYPFKERNPGEPSLPKGVDPLTLQKVLAVFKQPHPQGLSAEVIGKTIGTSRTTARRYLEYLASTGQLDAELVYGSVGRPERKYFKE